MRLLLVRHGDPDYEKDCLTGLGHRQAEVVARRLLSENIDEIFSSPPLRALRQFKTYGDNRSPL